MRGFVAVVRREVLERRLALHAAALAAFLPFLVPIARGLRGLDAREARETTAVLLAMAFAAVLSTVLGWTALSRDLADRRIAFYFSRPLSDLAITAGKMAGAFLVALGSAAVVWLPSFLASRGRTVLADLPGWTPWAVVGGAAVLVIVFHAAGVALRSRSALLALDAAFLVLAVAACLWITGRLLGRMAFAPLRNGLVAAAAIVLLGLLAGGMAAIRQGRVDIRAAHRALSPRIWAGLGIAAAAFGGYALWVLSSSPKDMRLVGASAARNGTWVAVNGEARGAVAGFLLDARTGQYRQAGTAWPVWSGWFPPVFSEDGRLAAWFEPEGRTGPYQLVSLSLDEPAARPRPVAYTTLSLPQDLLLSPDGSRFATISSGSVSVGDLATGLLLTSARVAADGTTVFGSFLGRDRFRTYGWGGTRLDIAELDLVRRTLSRTGSVDGLRPTYSFCVDFSGERLLVGEHAGTRVRLFDARTGEPMAVIAEGPPMASSFMAFLSGGQIVVATAGPLGNRLKVFAPNGAPLRPIDLPPSQRVLLGAEAAPGQVVVATRPDASFWEGAISYLADVEAGTVRKIADDLTPVSWSFFSVRPVPAGSEAAKLFYGPGRSLVRLDPATGERRVILEGRR